MRLIFVSFYRKKRVGWLLPEEETGPNSELHLAQGPFVPCSASASAEVSDLETDVDRETQSVYIYLGQLLASLFTVNFSFMQINV